MNSFEKKRSRLRLAITATLLASLAIGVVGTVRAQGQSMEERLRAQLRTVTSQLQQAQNELAQIKAGGAGAGVAARPAAAPDAEALRADLAQSRSQLARERELRTRRDAEFAAAQLQAKEAVEKAGAQVAQFRGAYDELLKMARASEAERLRLGQENTLHTTAIAQCEAKNQQLYAVGTEVLEAYEKVDMSAVMSARQPFAAQARVKFEQIAQQYGDRLYQSKFDVRAVSVPAAPEK